MVRGETMLVNAKLVSDVSDLIMGGGNSFEVAIEIIKLVKQYDKDNPMPVPNGKITTTKIMQGLEKSEAEQCQDKTGPEVKDLEEKIAIQSQSQSD